MAELFHNTLDLLLPLNFDFILFIRLVHTLSEYLENWGASFAPQIVELNIINWRLLKAFDNLSSLFIYFVVGVCHINTSFKTPFFHQHVDLEEQSLLGLRLVGRAWLLGGTGGGSVTSIVWITNLRLWRS